MAIVLNVFALLAIKRSAVHTNVQKIWQMLIVLLIPVIGAALVLYVYSKAPHAKPNSNIHDESLWDTLAPSKHRSNAGIENDHVEHD